MTALKQEKSTMPNFVDIYMQFEKLSQQISGLESEIKRATEPKDLLEKPSFYRLMTRTPLGISDAAQRIAFFLPFVMHNENTVSLGQQLAEGNVSEMRLFQVLRSEQPNDLVQLRRLIQQIKPSLDWQKFGTMLYYWSKQEKRKLMADYFLHSNPDSKKSEGK